MTRLGGLATALLRGAAWAAAQPIDTAGASAQPIDATPHPRVSAAAPLATWRVAEGFEWVHVLGDEPACILALTRDGRLIGAPLATPPASPALLAPLSAGARLAAGPEPSSRRGLSDAPATQSAGAPLPAPGRARPPHAGHVRRFYAYDRTSVAAIDLPIGSERDVSADAPRGALPWRAGPAFEPREIRTDPEHYARILAVGATNEFVVVLRSDGQLALLSPLDGQVLRAHALPAPRAARLHIREDSVGLLVDVGSETRWIVIPSADQVFEEHRLTSDGRPAWGVWTPDGLLLAHPDKLSVFDTARERPRSVPLDEPARIATLTCARGATGAGDLYFVDVVQRVRCFDATRGRIAWTSDWSERPRIAQLVSGNGVLAVVGDEQVAFLDARTGDAVDIPALTAPAGESFVALRVEDGSRADETPAHDPSAARRVVPSSSEASFVFATRPTAGASAAPRVTLWRCVPVKHPSRRATVNGGAASGADALEWEGTSFALDPPIAIRELVLSGSRLVVVGADSIVVCESTAQRPGRAP